MQPRCLKAVFHFAVTFSFIALCVEHDFVCVGLLTGPALHYGTVKWLFKSLMQTWCPGDDSVPFIDFQQCHILTILRYQPVICTKISHKLIFAIGVLFIKINIPVTVPNPAMENHLIICKCVNSESTLASKLKETCICCNTNNILSRNRMQLERHLGCLSTLTQHAVFNLALNVPLVSFHSHTNLKRFPYRIIYLLLFTLRLLHEWTCSVLTETKVYVGTKIRNLFNA